ARTIAHPAQLPTGTGYELTRYYHLDGTDWASYWAEGLDHFRYYPPTNSAAGVILYEGATPGDTQHLVAVMGLAAHIGELISASPGQDAALQALLAAAPGAEATAQHAPSAPAASRSQTTAPAQATPARSIAWSLTAWMAVLGALSLALLGGTLGFRLRRSWGQGQVAPLGMPVVGKRTADADAKADH